MTTPSPHTCSDACVCALHAQPLVWWRDSRHLCPISRCPAYPSVALAAFADALWAIIKRPCPPKEFELRA